MSERVIQGLLIEDNPADARLIKEQLCDARQHLLELEWVQELGEGLERLRRGGIDVVLLDLSLPDSQGLPTLSTLLQELPSLLVLVLTGHDDEEVSMQALQLGAQDYILKGQGDGDLLQRLVRNALERHRLRLELGETARELKSGEKRFRILLEQSLDGIIVLDQEGCVRFANPAAETLLNRSTDELKGQYFGFPLSEEENVEIELLWSDGKRHYAEMRMTATQWGEESLWLVSLHDITERKRAEQCLEMSSQFLQIANQHDSLERLLLTFLEQAHAFVSCEAIAIRLIEEQRETVQFSEGFPPSFYKESCPSMFDERCLCSRLLRGTMEPSLPCCTEGGSFYFCESESLGPGLPEEELLLYPCYQQGYRSLGLIPIRQGKETMGIIHVADQAARRISLDAIEVLERAGRQLAPAIQRIHAQEGYRQSLKQISEAMEVTVQAMAKTLESRDPYTAGHQQRVAHLAQAIARQMGLSSSQIDGLRVAGTLHDIGKIHVPAEILSKPSRLTRVEFELIKTHAQVGYEILQNINFPWPVAEIVYQHHERIDGSGYPRGLQGEELLLEARILGVADVVEAMAADRPYRPAVGLEIALQEIANKRGVCFDPAAVDACLVLFQQQGYRFATVHDEGPLPGKQRGENGQGGPGKNGKGARGEAT